MRRNYAFLNLFRASAAAWVLVAHCMILGGWFPRWMLDPGMAVDVFMLISGFLMAAQGSDALADPANRARFWLRRFFRIAPAYYVALAIAAVAAPYWRDGFASISQGLAFPASQNPAAVHYDAASLLFHVSLLFGLSPEYATSTMLPDWSLSLEMQFYLAFPALFLLMQRRGYLEAGLAVALVVLVVGHGVASISGFAQPSLLPFKLHYFIAGMLAFRAVRDGEPRYALGALLLAYVAHDLGYVVLRLLLVMMILGRLEVTGKLPAFITALLRSRVVTFASDVSYSVYLFHMLWIAGAGLLLLRWPELRLPDASARVGLLVAFVVPGAYATAWLSYRLVELPGIRLCKRLTDQAASPSTLPVTT